MSENSSSFRFNDSMTNVNDSTTIGIVYLVTSVLVMISNGIVMVVVVTSRELHLPTLWNIAFMALCDFSYGLYYLIFAVPSALMNQFTYPDTLLVPSACLNSLLVGQNVLNVIIACIDRYMAVCWPLRYATLMTAERFIIAVLITIAINICRLCLIVLPEIDVYYGENLAITISKFDRLVSVLASVGLPVVAILTITALLLFISKEIVRSREVVSLGTIQPRVSTFSFTITLSAGIFCLSYLPSCICVIWNLMFGRYNVPQILMKFGIVSLLSNSLWNVVIYATTYRPFRHAFLRLFCEKYYRGRRQLEIHVISQRERYGLRV